MTKEEAVAMVISTHSLTRRLTGAVESGGQVYGISTHSLTRRLTIQILNILECTEFQLTASQGG